MPAFEQGATPDRYALIPRTLIFVTRGNQVLLLKGSPHKRLWANRYNGYGGHVEKGEDILTSARREFAEETGLTAPPMRLGGIITVDTGSSPGIEIYVLRGELPHGDPQPSCEGKPEWVPFDAIDRLPLVEDLYIWLPRFLAMQPCDPPFFAHSTYDQQGNFVFTFG